jgi:hypothetical protein
MAKAIFEREFNYSSRSRNVGWSAKPSPKPQSFPREFIDAAVAAGAARRVPPQRRKTAIGPDQTGE